MGKTNFIPVAIIVAIVIAIFLFWKQIQGFFGSAFGLVTNTLDTVQEAGTGLSQNLGFTDSDVVKDVKKLNSDSSNCWSPTFYKNCPGGTLLPNMAKSTNIINAIYDSRGFMSASIQECLSAFKQLKNQASVSLVAERFIQQKGVDLLSFISRQAPIAFWHIATDLKATFYDDDLKQIIDYVSSLPKYS